MPTTQASLSPSWVSKFFHMAILYSLIFRDTFSFTSSIITSKRLAQTSICIFTSPEAQAPISNCLLELQEQQHVPHDQYGKNQIYQQISPQQICLSSSVPYNRLRHHHFLSQQNSKCWCYPWFLLVLLPSLPTIWAVTKYQRIHF